MKSPARNWRRDSRGSLGLPGAAPGSIALTPLAGSVQLSGDEHFRVD